MDHMQWYDYMRVTTATLSVIAGFRLTRLVARTEDDMTNRMLEFLYLIYALFFMIFMGSLELMLNDVGYSYTAVVSLIIMLVAIRATRFSPHPLEDDSKN